MDKIFSIILYRISKVPFEIPHKISYPYIERCLLRGENLRPPRFMSLLSVFEKKKKKKKKQTKCTMEYE